MMEVNYIVEREKRSQFGAKNPEMVTTMMPDANVSPDAAIDYCDVRVDAIAIRSAMDLEEEESHQAQWGHLKLTFAAIKVLFGFFFYLIIRMVY